MERRLDQPALPHVALVFARQQAVAEQHSRPLQTDAFVKRSMACDEDVPDVVRMVQDGKRRPADSKKHDITVRIRETAQERQPVANEGDLQTTWNQG